MSQVALWDLQVASVFRVRGSAESHGPPWVCTGHKCSLYTNGLTVKIVIDNIIFLIHGMIYIGVGRWIQLGNRSVSCRACLCVCVRAVLIVRSNPGKKSEASFFLF